MKVSEILTILKSEGWVQIAMRGSHRQFKHPSKDLHPATLNSILKQAGLK